tara:strand:- start:6 stop:182 length:177 start_codon:yes stop_codon:yes gene_type:complete
MNYWLVNQNQSWEQEIRGAYQGYLFNVPHEMAALIFIYPLSFPHQLFPKSLNNYHRKD